METRILIPEALSIVIQNSSSKSSKRNSEDKKEEIEKPTSSSGCIEEEEEDNEDSDESSSKSISSRSSNSRKSTSGDSVVSSGGNNNSNIGKRHKIVRNSSSTNNKVCSQTNTKDSKDKDHVYNSDNNIVSSADSDKKNSNNNSNIAKVLTDEINSRRKSFVKICANQIIEKGRKFSPNEGEVRVLSLNKTVSQFPPDDIRFVFGCFDRTTEDPIDEDKEIRLCNWIRFVKRAKDKYQDGVNVVARFSDRQPIFELTKTLLPGTELFVFFDIESIAQMNGRTKDEKDSRSLQQESGGGGKPDGPLDLSKSPIEKPKTKPGATLLDFQTFSAQPSLNSSEKVFSGVKIKSPTIFSISNVLQPIKLFQPYSISHHNNSHSRSSREYSRTPPSNVNIGGMNHHNSINSGLLATTPSSIGSSSPSATNSPTLRPILRTRGRERSLLPCDVCGKAFDRPSLLKRHMRTHTGEKPHICDVCSKGFSTSSSLNTHRRIHSGEKPHQCPICGKRFTASSNLYYHRMTHNKEKPHKCLLCGKSFPTPGDLKSHQYVHSGSWPYNCPICHRGFSKQTNLRNHLLLHSGDKPHNCQICGKKFALACNLRAHLRTHEEDPISSCLSCKRTFLSSLNMLVNGQCRSCILHHNNVNVNTNINITTNNNNSSPGDVKSKTSGGINLELVPVSTHSYSHSTPTTISSEVSQSLGNLATLQVPTGTIAPLPGFLPTHTSPLFHGAITDGMSGFNRPNPFLEQLFEWNYRFAKETAGNLGLHFQQKLLESQMLAAQLMSVSNSQGMANIGIGISDILRLRSQEFPSMDSVNKFAQ